MLLPSDEACDGMIAVIPPTEFVTMDLIKFSTNDNNLFSP